MLRLAALSLAVASLSLVASPARAAGLYFSDRGVRPLSRGGAFVAGADDLGAMAYNPAGLFDAGTSMMLDASWLHFTSDYTRQAIVRQLDPNTGKELTRYQQTFPSVEGGSPVLPIPTLGASFQPHEQWVLAFGAWAPYAAITSYPESVNGKPAPQRYSLLTLNGSALAIVGGWAAFAPSKEWRLGAGVEVLVGSFQSSVVMSGCVPERFFCAPEQPQWDVLSQLTVGPIVAPSGNFGAIWAPSPKWRFGAAFQLPFYVRAAGKITTRMPQTPVFDRAHQEGEDADVSFDLPWTLRAGVETRMIDDLRVELGFAYDRWSMHDQIRVDPKGVSLDDVAGFPKKYYVPPVTFARNFQDSASVRLGGEYSFDLAGYKWDARAGVSYESSAVPAEYLSVLTVDMPKVTLALGGSLHLGKIRLDATYAHIFATSVTVDPADARIGQVSPVQANPPKYPDTVNGGTYAARADVLGVGIAYTFDPAPAKWQPGASEPAPAPNPEPAAKRVDPEPAAADETPPTAMPEPAPEPTPAEEAPAPEPAKKAGKPHKPSFIQKKR
jgi:long-chain fatty acid transport protein